MSQSSTRRWIFWAVIGSAVVIMFVLALAPKAIPVDLSTVTRGPLIVTLDHEGRTRAKDIFVISAPLPGHVQRIEHEPGDSVVAGETVLATFSPAAAIMLDARTRAEAVARVETAAAALEQARAERSRARVEADFATADSERIRVLAAQGVVSATELEVATTTAQAARDSLVAAEAAVKASVHQLEAANATLLDPVDETVSGQQSTTLELRSPVDGIVLRRLRESSAVVSQGEPLLEVADPTELEITADFLSRDTVKMRAGMPVIIERWGGEEELKGRVRRIEPAGFMKISALGVEEQRVWVIIDFDDGPDTWQGLGDDFRVEVRVVVWQNDGALRAPTAALFREGADWAVLVEDDGRAELRRVDVGQQNGLQTQILDGLSDGEQIIIHPPDSVQHGSRVTQR